MARRVISSKRAATNKLKLLEELSANEAELAKAKEKVSKIRAKLDALMFVGEAIPFGNRIFAKREKEYVVLPPKEELLSVLDSSTYEEVSVPQVSLIKKRLGTAWVDEFCTKETKIVLGWEAAPKKRRRGQK